jgi:hypothetical protein
MPASCTTCKPLFKDGLFHSSAQPFDLQVFDLASTTAEAAIKSIFAKLDEMDRQGYSAAQYIASRVSFMLVGDHQRVYNTLQVLSAHIACMGSQEFHFQGLK